MFDRLKDLFIPHEGNKFRPDFLERLSVGIMLVLILLSFAMANLQSLLWISSDWLVSTILPAVIVDLTNDERSSERVGTLTRSALLDKAANLKAEDMAKNEYFAHYSPTGVSPWYWLDQAGYNYLHAGENLAVHFTDSSDVLSAWMDSPSHRANIMNGDYIEIGIGTAKGEYKGQPTIYVVQLFGTKRDTVTTPSVAGASAASPANEPQVSIEKIAISDAPTATSTAVAPATIDTATLLAPATTSPIESELEVIREAGAPSEAIIASAEPENVQDETKPASMYSDLATTSQDGVPTLSTGENSGLRTNISMPLRSATEPSLWLTTLYGFLASIVIFALVLSVRLEWRSHHPVQVAYAGGLLVAMALLLYIHTSLTGIVTIV